MATNKSATKHDVSNKIKYTVLKTKETDDEHKVEMSEDISLLENMETVRLTDDNQDYTAAPAPASNTYEDVVNVPKVAEDNRKAVLTDGNEHVQDKPVCDIEKKDNSVETKLESDSKPCRAESENSDTDTNLDIVRKMSQVRPRQEVQWRQIGSYSELKQKACQRIYAKSGREDDLALFFVNGMFHIMDAWCSHMGGPLFEGDIEDYNGQCHVMCPWHSYMFDLKTGMNEIGLQQNVYELKLENAHVYARYKSELSISPIRKQSEVRRVIQPPSNKKNTKQENPSRKDSVLENVMRL